MESHYQDMEKSLNFESCIELNPEISSTFMTPWSCLIGRGLLLPEEPSSHSCAVESSTFSSPRTSTSSRTNKCWPRWDGLRKQTQTQACAQAHGGSRSHSLLLLVVCELSDVLFVSPFPPKNPPKKSKKCLIPANLTCPVLRLSALSPRCCHTLTLPVYRLSHWAVWPSRRYALMLSCKASWRWPQVGAAP